jgi:hypothetical protein
VGFNAQQKRPKAKKEEKERDVWLRGGEKERMHGDSVCRRFENLFYERTSKAKEEFKEVHY